MCEENITTIDLAAQRLGLRAHVSVWTSSATNEIAKVRLPEDGFMHRAINHRRSLSAERCDFCEMIGT